MLACSTACGQTEAEAPDEITQRSLDSLLNAGQLQLRSGSISQAEEIYKKGVALTSVRKMYHPFFGGASYASFVEALAGLHDISPGKKKTYVLLYEEYFLASEKKAEKDGRPVDVFALPKLVDWLFEIGEKEKGVDMVEARLAKAGKDKKNNPAIYMVMLGMHAKVLARTEQYDRAEKIIVQEMLPYVNTNFPNEAARISMEQENFLGALNERKGDLQNAELHYRNAIEKLKQMPKLEHWTQYHQLSRVLIAQGRYSEVAQLYREDAERMKKTGNMTEYFIQLSNLLEIYENLGLGQAQMEILIEIFKLAKDDLDKSTSVANIGDFLLEQGYPAIKVDSIYSVAAGLAGNASQAGVRKVLLTARNSYKLAKIKYVRGRYDDARTWIEKSINAFNELEQLGRKDLASEKATAIVLKANLPMSPGEALQNIDEALSEVEKAGGKFTVHYFNLLEAKIQQLVSQSRADEAKGLVKELETVLKRIGFENAAYRVDYIQSIGDAYDLTGDFEKAKEIFQATIADTRESIESNLAGLSEAEFNEFYQSKKNIFQSFTRFAIRHQQQLPGLNGMVYDNLLLLKGISFRTEQKLLEIAAQQTDPVFKKKVASWRVKKDSLNYLMRSKSTDQQIKKIRSQLQTLEREMSQVSKYADNVFGRQSWKTIRDNLLPGECAVEIIRTPAGFASRDLPVYVALVIDRDTKEHPRMITITSDRKTEESYLKYYFNTILGFMTDNKSYEFYWKPLEDALAGKNKIYLSADGVYHLINLNTLFNPSTNRYLIDEKQVKRLNSTAGVLTIDRGSKRNLPASAVLFGNPSFNNEEETKAVLTGSNSSRFITDGKITPLPGTAVEIETVQKTLQAKKVSTVAYTTTSASESTLKRVRSPGILHIATHGFFLEQSEVPTNFLGIESRYLSNPLLRSGLLLSGSQASFTNPGNSGKEDGVITAQEASLLNLFQTELVVLSACQTGLGELQSGEGVYGLQRSFQIAGAKSVIISLWKVSDEATMLLMSAFYKHWDKSTTAEQAFINAQYELRQKFPEPYYWGAFMFVSM